MQAFALNKKLKARYKLDRERGLTVARLAVIVLGVHPNTVFNWLNRRTHVRGINNRARVEAYVDGRLDGVVDEALTVRDYQGVSDGRA